MLMRYCVIIRVQRTLITQNFLVNTLDALALFISLRQETAVNGVNTKSLAYLATNATRLQTHQSKRNREAQTVVRPLTHLSHPFLSLYAGIIMTYL